MTAHRDKGGGVEMTDKDEGMKCIVRPEGRSVVLPTPALDVLGTEAVVAKVLDGGIALCTREEWEKMKHRLLSVSFRGNGKNFARFLLSGAEEVSVNKDGVLVIPERFTELCRDIMEAEVRESGVILRPVE